ncbi:MAG: DUF3311 domain-containing protein [Planctomycetota bacterium]
MSGSRRPTAWWVVWSLVAVLAILRNDLWNWSDDTLLFGFLPLGLAYHAGISIAAGLLWAAVVRFAWPAELEAWAEDEQPHRSGGRS